MQGFRYTLPLLPPLAVLVAVGAAAALGWAGQRWPGRRPAAALVTLVAVALAWMASSGWALTRDLVARHRANLDTVRWVEARVPADARVLAYDLTATLQHSSRLETHELFAATPASVVALAADGRPLFVAADLDRVRRQWPGRPVAETVSWLERGPGLEPVGERSGLGLYRVGGGVTTPAAEAAGP